MNPQTQEARPPYVSFVVKAIEDRSASIAAGHVVMIDVDYALITPHGSKDRLEKVVKDWFETLDEAVKQERMPRQWVDAYKAAYAAFKEGREIPLAGTSVRNWPLLTPAQVENLISLKALTVEDLAAANEELVARLGMGGRALKEKAQNWLMVAGSSGAKTTEQLSRLESENRQLRATNEEMAATLTQLKARVDAIDRAAATPVKATATA